MTPEQPEELTADDRMELLRIAVKLFDGKVFPTGPHNVHEVVDLTARLAACTVQTAWAFEEYVLRQEVSE